MKNWREKYNKKVIALRNCKTDDKMVVAFGYRIRRGNEIFKIVDFKNIEDFIFLTLAEAFKEVEDNLFAPWHYIKDENKYPDARWQRENYGAGKYNQCLAEVKEKIKEIKEKYL